MDLFDKAVQKAKEVGNNVASTAVNVGNSIRSTTKEQTELAGLKLQKSTIDKKLENLYAQIGRAYVNYVNAYDTETLFDVNDIIEKMKPELEQMDKIDVRIKELEEQIKQNNYERYAKRAEEQFEAEKEKLDKALSMDIIPEYEYQEKLAYAQKKLDYFEEIRKIDLQYEMNIISKKEHDQKIDEILKSDQ